MRWLALSVLFAPLLCLGQSGTTAVTAIVADANGSAYVNCQWSVTFVGQNTTPGSGPYAPAGLLNGQQSHCDSTGAIAVNLADNVNTVTPTPSQWQFNICSSSGYPAGPYCFQKLITISGASQNISASLTSSAPILPAFNGTNLTPGTPVGSIQVRSSSSTFAGGSSILYASQQTGADCGAKINAADTLLGANTGEIWVDQACGTITTAPTLNPGHYVRFIQFGNYFYCGEWTLNRATGIIGPPSGIVEDIVNHPLPAIELTQGNGCNLPISFLVAGANVAIEGIAINGNYGGNGANEVGITFDTSVTTANSRGRFWMHDSTVGNFSGDDVQITSTSTNDQAIHAEMDYVSLNRSIGGNCLTVTNTTDVKLHSVFREFCAGYGIRNINSTIWLDSSADGSTNNAAAIYITGSSASGTQLNAGMLITNDSIASPSLTSFAGGQNASNVGGIVVQGWDGSVCNTASVQIYNTSFGVVGGSLTNAWDMVHIENAGGSILSGNKFAGPPSGSMARYAYYHANTQSCATLPPDIIGAGNEFTGSFATGVISALAADIFVANLEIANSGFTQARIRNMFLENTFPLYCGNASATPEPCLKTDGTNLMHIMGDPAAGAGISLEPRGGTVAMDVVPGGFALNNQTNTFSSGSGVPAGNCADGSLYTNSTPADVSHILYLCKSNSWTAVTVP